MMRTAILAMAFTLAATGASHGTSGFGCYRVNVGPSDPLRIRALPSAESAAIAHYSWNDGPIIALEGLERGEEIQPELFDVHVAEGENCVPSGLPRGARWCPVTIFDGDAELEGWLKRRFVDHSECP